MTRARMMEEIAELDRRINQEIDKTRVPRLNLKHRSFPITNWVLVALCLLWWLLGAQLHVGYHTRFGIYGLYAGLLFGAIALFRTMMWVVKGKAKVDERYNEATKEVQKLQDRRMELQKQLAKMDQEQGA